MLFVGLRGFRPGAGIFDAGVKTGFLVVLSRVWINGWTGELCGFGLNSARYLLLVLAKVRRFFPF